jgi:C1A family cysteine protease
MPEHDSLPVTALYSENQDKLAALGIVTEQQLRAVLVIPGIRQLLAQYLDSPLEGVPQLEAQAVAAPVSYETEMPLGALLPPPGVLAGVHRLPLMTTQQPIALPAEVSLVGQMPPIRHQGSRGTCVAFTHTAISEFTGDTQLKLSERHLYFRAKKIDGKPAECGTYQYVSASVLRTSGQCRAELWPYNPDAECNDHGTEPADAPNDALNYMLSLSPLNPNDVVAIKTALSRDAPVGVSIPVFDSWYKSSETRRAGRITLPIGNEQHVGGHAVCLVGYRDDADVPGGGAFIVRNSWGAGWAAESEHGPGYGMIPYAYITTRNWEAFTLHGVV